MSPYQEEIILPMINKLDISSKFKVLLKWEQLKEGKWRDAAGEIKLFCITFKWFFGYLHPCGLGWVFF